MHATAWPYKQVSQRRQARERRRVEGSNVVVRQIPNKAFEDWQAAQRQPTQRVMAAYAMCAHTAALSYTYTVVHTDSSTGSGLQRHHQATTSVGCSSDLYNGTAISIHVMILMPPPLLHQCNHRCYGNHRTCIRVICKCVLQSAYRTCICEFMLIRHNRVTEYNYCLHVVVFASRI